MRAVISSWLPRSWPVTGDAGPMWHTQWSHKECTQLSLQRYYTLPHLQQPPCCRRPTPWAFACAGRAGEHVSSSALRELQPAQKSPWPCINFVAGHTLTSVCSRGVDTRRTPRHASPCLAYVSQRISSHVAAAATTLAFLQLSGMPLAHAPQPPTSGRASPILASPLAVPPPPTHCVHS